MCVSCRFRFAAFVCRCRSLPLLVVLPRLLVVVVCRCRLPLLLAVFVCRCCFCRCPCRLGLFVLVLSWSLVAVAVAFRGPRTLVFVTYDLPSLEKAIQWPLWREICPRGPQWLSVHTAWFKQMPCEALYAQAAQLMLVNKQHVLLDFNDLHSL